MTKKRKTKQPVTAKPSAEAVERVLKAVDVARMLYEHKDAKLIGRRNRDKGFVILLMHLDRAYKALVGPSHGKPAKADPIFKALEAFKKEDAEFSALCEAQEDPGDGTTAEKRAWRAAENRLQSTMDKVCETKPTTRAGVRAQLEFVAKYHEDHLQSYDSLDNENIEKALGRASAAVAEMVSA